MRSWHAIILALGIASAGFFIGGIFEFDTSGEDYIVRLNRLTGAVSFHATLESRTTALTLRSLDPTPGPRRAPR